MIFGMEDFILLLLLYEHIIKYQCENEYSISNYLSSVLDLLIPFTFGHVLRHGPLTFYWLFISSLLFRDLFWTPNYNIATQLNDSCSRFNYEFLGRFLSDRDRIIVNSTMFLSKGLSFTMYKRY